MLRCSLPEGGLFRFCRACGALVRWRTFIMANGKRRQLPVENGSDALHVCLSRKTLVRLPRVREQRKRREGANG